jgi:Ino eighty subunit 2
VPKTGVSRQNIVAGKRASRSSRIVREVDSEDEEEDDDDDEAEEADAMDVDDDEDDEDAEGDEDEDMDAEGDEDDDMDSGSPASRIVVSTKPSIPVKPVINITKAQDSVEAKEMAMDDDDDDELSDPDSDLDEEDAEGEDEDAEGEEDDDMVGQNGDPDEEMDSDEDFSRGQTPADVSKMTKRQRALMEEGEDGALMALSNEAQKKKHLTAEENAMRRAEMARRRKNLSEKRNEEEKVCLVPSWSSHKLIKFRWTPSIVSSRNSHLNAAARLLMSREKMARMTTVIPRGRIHFLSDMCKTQRALNLVFQASGCRLP